MQQWRDKCAASTGLMHRFPNFWWYVIRNPVGNIRFLFKDEGEVQRYGNFLEPRLSNWTLRQAGLTEGHRWNVRGWAGSYESVKLITLDKEDKVTVVARNQDWQESE